MFADAPRAIEFARFCGNISSNIRYLHAEEAEYLNMQRAKQLGLAEQEFATCLRKGFRKVIDKELMKARGKLEIAIYYPF